MVTTLEQGDIFGRIGKSIGQGVSEQAERSMLSNQLAGIKGFPKEASDLIRAPGGREALPTVLPYIQSQRQKEAAREAAREAGKKSPSVIASVDQKKQGISQQADTQSLSPRFDRSASNYLVRADPAVLDQQAADLSDETGIPFQDVRNKLESNDVDRVGSEMQFEDRALNARNEFRNHVSDLTQKPGNEIYRDLTGAMLGDYSALLDNDIANGATPRQAIESRGKELLEVAKARQQISTEGAKRAYSTSPEQSRKIIRNLREDYKKYNQLDLYQKDLVGKIGMRPAYASSIAFPVSEHEEIIPYIKSANKTPNESFDKIAKEVGKNDSLFSIALAIDENAGKTQGLGQRFLDKIAADRKAGKFDPSERQARELADPYRNDSSLTDIWYTSLFGKRGVS